MLLKEVGESVKERIRNDWLDSQVAQWVINQLEILSLQENDNPASVAQLLSNGQLIDKDGVILDLSLEHNFVISGGLEGTAGHISALRQVVESKIFTDCASSKRVIVFLEPDSYITENKNREPLLLQKERALCWASSGLVDRVILLPEHFDLGLSQYEEMERVVSPATWFAAPDHPALLEVIKRDFKKAISIGQIIDLYIGPHASFLAKSKVWDKDTLLSELFSYLTYLTDQKFSNSGLQSINYEEEVRVVFENIVDELRDK